MKDINYLYSSLQKLSDEAKDKAVSFEYLSALTCLLNFTSPISEIEI
jgi:hypothetical protein